MSIPFLHAIFPAPLPLTSIMLTPEQKCIFLHASVCAITICTDAITFLCAVYNSAAVTFLWTSHASHDVLTSEDSCILQQKLSYMLSLEWFADYFVLWNGVSS